MKRVLAFALAFVMLLAIFAGCSKKKKPSGNDDSGTNNPPSPTLPYGLNGREAARLLLANERLNPDDFKCDGEIFDSGIKAMNTLSERAIKNLGANYVSGSDKGIVMLAESYGDDTHGRLEIDDDKFTWRSFGENNNSYSYFKNITDAIVSNAELAADLIDDMKKNVRVVDKWVQADNVKYYLHVDSYSEFLCSYDITNGEIKICKRSTSYEGKSEYEFYFSNELSTTRMTYVEGQTYGMSSVNFYEDQKTGTYFYADNSKGYWETYSVGDVGDHYNVSYFIMKDNICYDALYDPEVESVMLLKVMSADRNTDIFNVSDMGIDVKFSGFDGIDRLEAPVSASTFYPDGQYGLCEDSSQAKVYLSSGTVISEGDSFVDGQVTVNQIRLSYSGEDGYTGELGLVFDGENTREQNMALTKQFILEVGLRCRRDLDGTFADVDKALADLDDMIKYYQWNYRFVNTSEGIASAIELENYYCEKNAESYDNIKNMPVVNKNDLGDMQMSISFAPISEKSFENIKLDGLCLNVGKISLTVSDTLLFVKDSSYRVEFALLQEDGTLARVSSLHQNNILYVGGDTFTVVLENYQFYLPVMIEGNFIPVVYIATDDYVRSSAYVPLEIGTVEGFPLNIDNMHVSAALKPDAGVAITYDEVFEFTVNYETEYWIGYDEFYDHIASVVYRYGSIKDGIIEVNTGEGYVPMLTNVPNIEDGTYRMAYTTQRPDGVKTGYVYFNYNSRNKG